MSCITDMPPPAGASGRLLMVSTLGPLCSCISRIGANDGIRYAQASCCLHRLPLQKDPMHPVVRPCRPSAHPWHKNPQLVCAHRDRAIHIHARLQQLPGHQDRSQNQYHSETRRVRRLNLMAASGLAHASCTPRRRRCCTTCHSAAAATRCFSVWPLISRAVSRYTAWSRASAAIATAYSPSPASSGRLLLPRGGG